MRYRYIHRMVPSDSYNCRPDSTGYNTAFGTPLALPTATVPVELTAGYNTVVFYIFTGNY